MNAKPPNFQFNLKFQLFLYSFLFFFIAVSIIHQCHLIMVCSFQLSMVQCNSVEIGVR